MLDVDTLETAAGARTRLCREAETAKAEMRLPLLQASYTTAPLQRVAVAAPHLTESLPFPALHARGRTRLA